MEFHSESRSFGQASVEECGILGSARHVPLRHCEFFCASASVLSGALSRMYIVGRLESPPIPISGMMSTADLLFQMRST